LDYSSVLLHISRGFLLSIQNLSCCLFLKTLYNKDAAVAGVQYTMQMPLVESYHQSFDRCGDLELASC